MHHPTQDNTCYGFCYTSCVALAGTRNRTRICFYEHPNLQVYLYFITESDLSGKKYIYISGFYGFRLPGILHDKPWHQKTVKIQNRLRKWMT